MDLDINAAKLSPLLRGGVYNRLEVFYNLLLLVEEFFISTNIEVKNMHNSLHNVPLLLVLSYELKK